MKRFLIICLIAVNALALTAAAADTGSVATTDPATVSSTPEVACVPDSGTASVDSVIAAGTIAANEEIVPCDPTVDICESDMSGCLSCLALGAVIEYFGEDAVNAETVIKTRLCVLKHCGI